MGSDKYRKRSISLEGRKDVLEEVFGGEGELRVLISSTWPQRSHLSPLRMIPYYTFSYMLNDRIELSSEHQAIILKYSIMINILSHSKS